MLVGLIYLTVIYRTIVSTLDVISTLESNA